MSKVLVILGMHRSGTSLLANLLHESGIILGESLMPSTKLNPKGYYEDMEIYHLHDRILKANNLPYTVTNNDEYSLSQNHKESIAQVITDRKDMHQWGWKEPRTCLFVHTWHDLLIAAGHEPYYVFSYRPLEQVIDSMIRRDIVEIKLYNKLIPRWQKLRRYNKELRAKQLHYMESWRHHLNELMTFHKKHSSRSAVLYSPEISTDFPLLQKRLETDWGFQLKDINFEKIYSEELFNRLAEIRQYSDKNIQSIQNYFMANRLS